MRVIGGPLADWLELDSEGLVGTGADADAFGLAGGGGPWAEAGGGDAEEKIFVGRDFDFAIVDLRGEEVFHVGRMKPARDFGFDFEIGELGFCGGVDDLNGDAAGLGLKSDRDVGGQFASCDLRDRDGVRVEEFENRYACAGIDFLAVVGEHRVFSCADSFETKPAGGIGGDSWQKAVESFVVRPGGDGDSGGGFAAGAEHGAMDHACAVVTLDDALGGGGRGGEDCEDEKDERDGETAD